MNKKKLPSAESVLDALIADTLAATLAEEIAQYAQKAEREQAAPSALADARIQKLEKQKRKAAQKRGILRRGFYAAAVLAVIVITHLTLYTFVDAYRYPLQKLLLQLTETSGTVTLVPEGNEGGIHSLAAPVEDSPFTLWVPDGFVLSSHQADSKSNVYFYYKWENANGEEIILDAKLHEGNQKGAEIAVEAAIDSEATTITKTVVNDNAAYYTVKKENQQTRHALVWNDNNYIFELIYTDNQDDGDGLDILRQIAESVRIV